jgi:hypothetical protein
VSSQLQASFPMCPHRPAARREIPEQAPFPGYVDSLSTLGHRCQLAHRFEQALGCIGKLRGVNALELASLMPASWNRLATWLQVIDGLRRAA